MRKESRMTPMFKAMQIAIYWGEESWRKSMLGR